MIISTFKANLHYLLFIFIFLHTSLCFSSEEVEEKNNSLKILRKTLEQGSTDSQFEYTFHFGREGKTPHTQVVLCNSLEIRIQGNNASNSGLYFKQMDQVTFPLGEREANEIEIALPLVNNRYAFMSPILKCVEEEYLDVFIFHYNTLKEPLKFYHITPIQGPSKYFSFNGFLYTIYILNARLEQTDSLSPSSFVT